MQSLLKKSTLVLILAGMGLILFTDSAFAKRDQTGARRVLSDCTNEGSCLDNGGCWSGGACVDCSQGSDSDQNCTEMGGCWVTGRGCTACDTIVIEEGTETGTDNPTYESEREDVSTGSTNAGGWSGNSSGSEGQGEDAEIEDFVEECETMLASLDLDCPETSCLAFADCAAKGGDAAGCFSQTACECNTPIKDSTDTGQEGNSAPRHIQEKVDKPIWLASDQEIFHGTGTEMDENLDRLRAGGLPRGSTRIILIPDKGIEGLYNALTKKQPEYKPSDFSVWAKSAVIDWDRIRNDLVLDQCLESMASYYNEAQSEDESGVADEGPVDKPDSEFRYR